MVDKNSYYLKTYRKRKGIQLSDMASILGVDVGNLSRIETGQTLPSLPVIISYHRILNIPLEKLFNFYYPNVNKECLNNAVSLQNHISGHHEELAENELSPKLINRKESIDAIIESLVEYKCQHEDH